MTACVNRKHTKKVAAVVTASLVGALSLGVAPVAAVADTGIETLATDQADFAKGTVSYKNGNPGDKFEYTGYNLGIVPTEVTTVSGEKLDDSEFDWYYVEIDSAGSNFAGVSYKDDKGNTQQLVGNKIGKAVDKPGTYAVVVYKTFTGGTAYIAVADTFTINTPSMKDAVIFDGDDITDTEFDYTGAAKSAQVGAWISRIHVALAGEVLDADDYQVKIWEKGGSAALGDTDPLKPGTTYIVRIEGLRDYKGQTVEKEFTFGKLDLSTATVEGKIVTAAAPDNTLTSIDDVVTSINGVSGFSNAAKNGIKVEFVSDPDGNQTSADSTNYGVYTYKLTGSGDYVEGSATVEVVYADTEATVNFRKCGDTAGFNSDGDYVVDLAGTTKQFDTSKVEFYNGSAKLSVDADDYTVTVTDDEGNAATLDDLKTPGTWFVKVDLMQWSNDGKNLTAGTGVQKVVVKYASVNENTDIFFSYDGVNYSYGCSDTYTGENFLDKVAVKVIVGTTTLTEGTDYTVTFEKQNADGSFTEVDKIVDAGSYRITVKGITYTEPASEFRFRVNKAPIYAFPAYDLVINDDMSQVDGAQYDGYFTYTGEALTPSFKFADYNGNEVALTADDYTVEYTGFASEDGKVVTTDVDEVKAAGTYIYTIDVSDDVENYEATQALTGWFWVTTKGIFLDVPTSGEWYSQVVYDAVKLEYMNGYSNSKLFGAGDSIKRGDVACVLYNMAGGDKAYIDNDFNYNELSGYETGFSDVNGKLYYGKAIAWAHASGVINGYGDGTFKPEQTITAEEFCAMLANYAKAMGDDVDGADLSVLDSMSDGDQVSDWAKQSVAWAVENEVMGNGGFVAPHEEIARERVAAMAVNYQPEGASDMVIPR